MKKLLVVTVCFLLLGCVSRTRTVPIPTATPAGHGHTAPHGGTLVVLGQEFAHLEFILDAESGTLSAYVLDGEAINTVRLPGTPLKLTIEREGELMLSPVADEATGETLQDTSLYRGSADFLKGKEQFKAILSHVSINGKDFEFVTFDFPEGNEHVGGAHVHEHHDSHGH